MSAAKLLFLAGDGIGLEVLAASEKVLLAISDKYDFAFDIQRADIGGAAIDAEGVPLSDATLEKARAVDATLMGAVGGPKWDNVAREIRPEAGLLKIRKGLDLFANLRPAWCFDALADASSLKRELVEGLDILIVRELTAGVYFGQPRGMVDGGARCVDTQSYTEAEVKRVARVGFEVARSRSGKLCSADKANVMETGHFWRQIVSEMGASEYPDVELSHMYADNCAMQLVRFPKQFDVIVTDNLFGDILSDQAAMLTGSLGMLPSASLGVPTGTGGDVVYKAALYEPVHGSAPDIAGQGLANPLGAIMSLAMLLKYSCKRADLAEKIEQAIDRALKSGVRTADIASAQHKSKASTAEITQAVISEL